MNIPAVLKFRWLGIVAAAALVAGPVTAANLDESLVPADAVASVVIPDTAGLHKAWQKTALAEIWNHAAMKPFTTDVDTKVANGDVIIPWLMGLSWDDISQLEGAGIVIHVAKTPKQPAAITMLMRLPANPQKAQAAIDAAQKRLLRKNPKKANVDLGGVQGVAMDLSPSLARGEFRQIVHVVKDGWFVGATNSAAAKDAIARLAGGAAGNITKEEFFRASTQRVAEGEKNATFRWFLRPLQFARTYRELFGIKPDPNRRDQLKDLESEGFLAIQAAGGVGVVGQGDELQIRGYIYAPPPYQRSMRMLSALENKRPEPLPAWIPGQSDSASVLNMRHAEAFEAYSTMFDTIYGNGAKGVFDDVLMGLDKDADGPQVDVRRDVVAKFTGPSYFLAVPVPNSPKGQTATSFQTTDKKLVEESFRKYFDGDPEVTQMIIRGANAWDVRPQGRAEGEWGFPESTVVMRDDYLIIGETPASVEILLGKNEPLTMAAEYQQIAKRLQEGVGQELCQHAFERFDRQLDSVFEDLRAGEESRLTDILRGMFGDEAKQSRIQYDKLPKYSEVQGRSRLLGGSAMKAEKDGWQLLYVVDRQAGPSAAE